MKRMAWMLHAALCGVVVANVAAQTKPDFSGRWTSDPAPSETAPSAGRKMAPGRGAGGQRAGGSGQARGVRSGDMGSGWGSNITITQDAASLTVEYAFFARGDMQPPLKFVYALDGTESENSVMMGRGRQVQISKSEWAGDTLIITTRHTFKHPESGQTITSEVKQKLSLESPDLLIVEAERSGVLGGPSSTTRTTYRKY
jgi:hypothetical protein